MIQETRSFPELHIELENTKTPSFDQSLKEAVDLTFAKLGVNVRRTFYSYLVVNYKLNKESIPDQIEEFVDALEGIFGKSALIIEIDLMKTLSQKVPSFKCEMRNPNLTFCEFLKSLRNFMETS